ncbi:ABC transporter substrate-binding protein [Caproiciproducens sp. R2]|uniref:ABC transporter substrate-binding protein n=1 Tax=Caproiciproducens sp. R2 TaxID=3435187 RepID=UPI0040337682
MTIKREVFYTICPLIVASHIAVEKGWLAEELEKAGAAPRFLREQPKSEWLAHFTSIHPNLFRDGGCIPPLWARSLSPVNKLIATTSFSRSGGQLVVRARDGIHTIADLRGKRIGLSLREKPDRVDFARATAHRAILLALRLGGLREDEVTLVDLPESEGKAGDPSWEKLEPAKNPVALWGGGKLRAQVWRDGQSLLDGRVDAVYARPGQSKPLEEKGLVTVIHRIADHPDWTLQVANTPTVVTVSTEVAEKYPEIPIAWLRASVKAGKWIRDNTREAAETFFEVTGESSLENIVQKLKEYDFVPNLSPKRLAALEIQKEFLWKHGYIEKDFSLEEWIDDRFLRQALR